MLGEFNALDEREYEILKDAVCWVTILVAGADGLIEKKELDWANKITGIRTYSGPKTLQDFYKEVDTNFSDKVESCINFLPSNTDSRNKELSEKLSELNEILPKLPPKLGFELYNSYTKLGEQVAKASGGVLGFFSVSGEEKQAIELHMLNPIEYNEEEE